MSEADRDLNDGVCLAAISGYASSIRRTADLWLMGVIGPDEQAAAANNLVRLTELMAVPMLKVAEGRVPEAGEEPSECAS